MRTVRGWETQFLLLYGEMNECRFRRGLAERIGFLHLGCQKLATAIRKGQHELIPGCLARILARTLAVTQHFSGLPFVEMLEQKWAGKKCGYCGRFPCICGQKRRPKPRLEVKTKDTRLTFRRLARILAAKYGANNQREGVWWILQRLTEEVNELGQLESELEDFALTASQMRREFALESSDVIAWTLAMANFFQVDLDVALEARYGTTCWHCHTCPCDCRLNDRRRRKSLTRQATTRKTSR